MTLTVSTALLDRSGLAILEGELDLAAGDLVATRVEEVLSTGVESLVLDLTGVTFMDAAGLTVLLDCRERAAAVGVRCVLTGAGRAVTRVLELTRTRQVLHELAG